MISLDYNLKTSKERKEYIERVLAENPTAE